MSSSLLRSTSTASWTTTCKAPAHLSQRAWKTTAPSFKSKSARSLSRQQSLGLEWPPKGSSLFFKRGSDEDRRPLGLKREPKRSSPFLPLLDGPRRPRSRKPSFKPDLRIRSSQKPSPGLKRTPEGSPAFSPLGSEGSRPPGGQRSLASLKKVLSREPLTTPAQARGPDLAARSSASAPAYETPQPRRSGHRALAGNSFSSVRSVAPHRPPQARRVPLPDAQQTTADGFIFRAVNIWGLAESTTLADITQALAEAGPFGMVLSARLLRNSEGKLGAVVVFDRERAVDDLVRAAKAGHVLVKSQNPFITRNTSLVFDAECRGLHFSRVLRVVGPADEPGFTQAEMRAVLAADPDILANFRKHGPSKYWGLESEPVREGILDDRRGSKMIEWAFFSHDYQTRPFLLCLRKHLSKRLYIDFGIDPCGFIDLIEGKPRHNLDRQSLKMGSRMKGPPQAPVAGASKYIDGGKLDQESRDNVDNMARPVRETTMDANGFAALFDTIDVAAAPPEAGIDPGNTKPSAEPVDQEAPIFKPTPPAEFGTEDGSITPGSKLEQLWAAVLDSDTTPRNPKAASRDKRLPFSGSLTASRGLDKDA